MASESTFKLVALTLRAAALGDGVLLESPTAAALKVFKAYFSNFLEKGQDEVHVKCQASGDRAIFRIINGAWTYMGIAPTPANPTPAKVEEAAVQFEFYALLLFRKEAELKEKLAKPPVIRRGAKNRVVERTIDPTPPPAIAGDAPPPPMNQPGDASVQADVAKALPDRQDFRNYVIDDGINKHTLPLRTDKIEQIADRLVDAIVNRRPQPPTTDIVEDEPQLHQADPQPAAPKTPQGPSTMTTLAYRVINVDTMVLLVLALFKHLEEIGKPGRFDIRDLINIMATGDARSPVKLRYNSPLFIKYRDHAHEYVERATKAIEAATGKALHTPMISVEVEKDSQGRPIKRKLKHFELRDKNWKA